MAAATQAPEAVRGSGEVDTARYGAVLRARGLVGVRGAGLDYDGFYFVRSVTHSITQGLVHAELHALSREGTGHALAGGAAMSDGRSWASTAASSATSRTR